MAVKIKSLINGGVAGRLGGFITVNGFHVCPTVQTAVAGGAILNASLIDDYSFFNVVQTSLASDVIQIPSAMEVGEQLVLFAQSAVTIGSQAGSGVTINAGANDTKTISAPASSLTVLTKTSSTTVIATQFAAAGTVSAPAPSI